MNNKAFLEGKRILLVDDELDIVNTLEELLFMCEVQKASTFEEARALLQSQAFDAAILDIMGVEGYRLLSLAKQKNIAVVMLTAHAFSPEDLAKSIKGGADAYLPKEEMMNIITFLADVLKALKKGENPWGPWHSRLPSSYFEKRWGAAWQESDKEFWERFRASIKGKKSSSS